jgi:uncharacterized membrane protein
MGVLIVVLLLFGAVHLLPAMPELKARAVAALGKAYGPVGGCTLGISPYGSPGIL